MAEGQLTDAERRAYVPPPCPMCGYQGDWRIVEWHNAEAMGTGPQWIPGLMDCPECRRRRAQDFDPFAE